MRTWLYTFALASALFGCTQDASDEDVGAPTRPSRQVACSPTADDAGKPQKPFAEEDEVIDDIGAPCTSDGECSAGKCVTSLTLPGSTSALRFSGGYCSVWCPDDRRCGRDAACPLYPVATFLPDVSVCFARCQTMRDCRAGYVCEALPPLPGDAPSTDTFCIPPSAPVR